MKDTCDMCGFLPSTPNHLVSVDGSNYCSYCYIEKLKETKKFLFRTEKSIGPYHGAKIYYFLQRDGRILSVTQETITYPFNECEFIEEEEFISFDEFHSSLKSVSQDKFEKYKSLTERTWKEFL